MTCDVLVTFNFVVVLSLTNEYLLKFILVYLLIRNANLNQHLDNLSKLSDLNNASIPLFLDFRHYLTYEFVLDLCILDNMSLELSHLQMLYTRQLHFRHVVLVHVHKNVLDHDDAQLLLLPDLIDPTQEIVFTATEQLLHYGVKKLDGCLLDTVVE